MNIILFYKISPLRIVCLFVYISVQVGEFINGKFSNVRIDRFIISMQRFIIFYCIRIIRYFKRRIFCIDIQFLS